MSDISNTTADLKNETRPEYIVQPKLHLEPLLIPEVIREIMKFIQPKDLYKYRLVCREWSKEIIPQIKDRFTFYFNSVQKLDDFMENGQTFFGFRNLNLKCLALNDSKKTTTSSFSSSHGKLLRRLHFDHGSIDSRPGFMFAALGINYIYQTLANSLELEFLKFTKLILVMPKEDQTFVLPPIIFYQLTTLDIDLYAMHGPAELHRELSIQTQEFYTQLLRIAPNLKELHLRGADCEARCGTYIHNCVRALMAVNPPKLKRLYFHSRIPFELARQLSTRLTSTIQKLVFDDLDSRCVLNFDSTTLTGNRIEMTTNGELYYGILIPASDIVNYYENKVAECEPGVSCTQLLQAFLTAFEERLQIQAGEANVH